MAEKLRMQFTKEATSTQCLKWDLQCFSLLSAYVLIETFLKLSILCFTHTQPQKQMDFSD